MDKLIKAENCINFKELLISQTAFSSGQSGSRKIKVYYISDIHLLHHLGKIGTKYSAHKKRGIIDSNDWFLIKKRIKLIVNKLFDAELQRDILSDPDNNILLFGGDTSSDTEITKYFYHYVQLRYLYYYHKWWQNNNRVILPITITEAKKQYQIELTNLNMLYEKKILQLFQWGIDYKEIKNNLRNNNLKNYITVNNLPLFIEFRIKELWSIEAQIEDLKLDKDSIIEQAVRGVKFIKPTGLPIFVILGNHELIEFDTIGDAVNDYKKFFYKERIHFIHNKLEQYDEFNILGGIGFAKYNNEFNATNTLTTTPPISRKREVRESEKFGAIYRNAVKGCKENFKPLILLSHYPLKDWYNKEYDSICTYFTGHSHINDSIHQPNINVYADNQIGYKRKNIQLKSCYLGLIYNPFIDYTDGCYEITTRQYAQFLFYHNESIEGTTLIDCQLAKGNAKFFMIKHSGFYGFFVINSKTGTKICVGGRIKNVSRIKDINYFDKCFLNVLEQFISILLPYRKFQEQISLEIKNLGYSGKIHGCIIDVDFFHHVMINPIDSSVTFYYSPSFGAVQIYETFYNLLANIEKIEFNNDKSTKLKIYRQMVNDNSLITQSSESIQKYIRKIVKIDIKNSMYALSNRLIQLQRIFTSNILRDWNDEWAQASLEENDPHMKLHSARRYKTDNEADAELLNRFDELIEIIKEEPNFVLWETKKQVTQAMMFAICRKFIDANLEAIKNFETVLYGYSVSRTCDYVNVVCSPLEILDIYKDLLTHKMQYGKSILFHLEINEKVEISICFVGASDILSYLGSYIYKDKKILRSQDLLE